MRRLTHGTERCGRGARRATALLTLLTALLVVPATAGAATDGRLKQLPLPNGCLDDAGAGGCRNISAPMANVGEPAFSPNGRFLYVPGRGSDSVNVFERNTTTGVLTERGCVSFVAATGCSLASVSPLEDATGVAVSPDGSTLYVVGGAAGDGGTAADGVAVFTIGANGLLSFSQCYNADASTSCSSAPGFGNPSSVAVSPDGKSVYVANTDAHTISVFARAANGSLNQASLLPAQKCIGHDATGGCTANGLMFGPRDIEVTPDNKQVLVVNTSYTGGFADSGLTLVAFDRTAATSALVQHPGGGCVSWTDQGHGCQVRTNFYAPTQFDMTADGRHIYVNQRGFSVNSVMEVERNPATGNLTPAQAPNGCAKYPGSRDDSSTPCSSQAKALNDSFDVALSPDGKYLYSAGYEGQRIGVFDRASNNNIVVRPGDLGCLTTPGQPDGGCGGVLNQGGKIEYVLPSKDGKNLYAVGLGKIFTFGVDHAPRCSSPTINTAHNTSVTITLPCLDQDGDPLSFQILSLPAKGQLGALQGNRVTYGPFLGTSGPDSFTFRATGAGMPADAATLTVNVAAPSSGGGGGGGGGTTPPPALTVLGSTVTNRWLPFPKYTKVFQLTVNDVPAGTRVRVQCKTKKKKQQKKGCPYKARTVATTFARTKLSLLKPFKKKRLPAGTRVSVSITAPGFIGKQFIYTTRNGKGPKPPKRLCIPPGGKPARCV